MWSLKKGHPVVKVLRHQYFEIEIYPLFTIRLSWNLLRQNHIDDLHLYLNMIFDIINLVFNKMEETFQSNTLDWSSLVLSYFSLPPPASLDFSLISQPISMKFGMSIVLDETKRCLKFQVNRTRGRDRAWSQSFTMLYNRTNSIYCA